jgi:hypothetical protein
MKLLYIETYRFGLVAGMASLNLLLPVNLYQFARDLDVVEVVWAAELPWAALAGPVALAALTLASTTSVLLAWWIVSRLFGPIQGGAITSAGMDTLVTVRALRPARLALVLLLMLLGVAVLLSLLIVNGTIPAHSVPLLDDELADSGSAPVSWYFAINTKTVIVGPIGMGVIVALLGAGVAALLRRFRVATAASFMTWICVFAPSVHARVNRGLGAASTTVDLET